MNLYWLPLVQKTVVICLKYQNKRITKEEALDQLNEILKPYEEELKKYHGWINKELPVELRTIMFRLEKAELWPKTILKILQSIEINAQKALDNLRKRGVNSKELDDLQQTLNISKKIHRS